MPANGLQGKRISIMNGLFRSPKGYSKSELIEKVGEGIKDYRKQTDKLKAGSGITGSSIDKDLKFMRDQLGAEIECVGANTNTLIQTLLQKEQHSTLMKLQM
jgi:hypothetical protein